LTFLHLCDTIVIIGVKTHVKIQFDLDLKGIEL